MTDVRFPVQADDRSGGRIMRDMVCIPFGVTTVAPLRAVRDGDAFTTELQDVNGCPLLTLRLDLATGQYQVAPTPNVVVCDNAGWS